VHAAVVAGVDASVVMEVVPPQAAERSGTDASATRVEREKTPGAMSISL
jgi:hypothetical protein